MLELLREERGEVTGATVDLAEDMSCFCDGRGQMQQVALLKR